MITAFDIDDTITRNPEFFSVLTHALRGAGHTVLIITFRDARKETEEDLRAWNIAYDTLITSDLQSCLEHGVDEWKGVVCREHGVEVFFEDDPEVLSHVDDSVLCLMPIDPDPARPQVVRPAGGGGAERSR